MKESKNISRRISCRRIEDVVGCKWSVSVLLSVLDGIARPGALKRHIQGISAKVLAERLRKLVDYGLLTKKNVSGGASQDRVFTDPGGTRFGETHRANAKNRLEARSDRRRRRRNALAPPTHTCGDWKDSFGAIGVGIGIGIGRRIQGISTSISSISRTRFPYSSPAADRERDRVRERARAPSGWPTQ